MTIHRRWHITSKGINEYVVAPDQWAAWNTLRNRPVEDFGLIVSAEPDDNDEAIPVHTATLMFAWNRDDDAALAIAVAIANDLPDTTVANLAVAEQHGRRVPA